MDSCFLTIPLQLHTSLQIQSADCCYAIANAIWCQQSLWLYKCILSEELTCCHICISLHQCYCWKFLVGCQIASSWRKWLEGDPKSTKFQSLPEYLLLATKKTMLRNASKHAACTAVRSYTSWTSPLCCTTVCPWGLADPMLNAGFIIQGASRETSTRRQLSQLLGSVCDAAAASLCVDLRCSTDQTRSSVNS